MNFIGVDSRQKNNGEILRKIIIVIFTSKRFEIIFHSIYRYIIFNIL
jgi:hypothetical protein